MLDIQGKLCSNDMIRDFLTPYIGHIVLIKHNLGRNKVDSFRAKIINVYNCLFLIKLHDDTVMSFSFSDIITKKIKLYEENKLNC